MRTLQQRIKNENKKRNILFSFFDYKNKNQRGSYWIGFIETYIPFHKIIDYAIIMIGVDSIIKQRSLWFVVIGGVAYLFLQVGSEIFKWFIGHLDYKKGIWKVEIDWGQKNEQYNPAYHEVKNTLENIAEKVGAKSGYKEL